MSTSDVRDGRNIRPDAAGGIAKQAATIFGARLAAAALSAVLVIVLARSLGPDGFGRYALALTIAMLVGIGADLGVGPATARFVAERLAEGTPIAKVMRDGLRLKLAIGVVALGALITLADVIAMAFGDSELAGLIRVAAAGILFADVFAWLASMYESLRDARGQVVMVAVKSGTEFVATVALVLGGAGAIGAVGGNAIGYAAAVAVGVLVLRPTLRVESPSSGVAARTLLGYGSHIWVAGLAWLAFDRVDQIMLGAFRDAASVALYEAPWRLMAVLSMAATALAAVVGPRLVGQRPEVAGRMVGDALRFSIGLGIITASILVVVAEDLVRVVLGDRYLPSVDVIRALLPFLIFVGLAPVASRALDYLGAARSRRWVAISAFGVNLVLDVVLIPTVGLLGAAFATDAAIAVFVLGHLVLLARRVPLQWSRVRLAIVRAILAGGVAATLALAITQLAVPVAVRLALAITVAALAAVGTLGALGETSMVHRLVGPALRRVAHRPIDASRLVPYAAAIALAAVGGALAAIDIRILVGLAVVAILAWLLMRDMTTGLVTFIIVAPLTQLPQLGAISGQFAKLAGGLLALAWIVSLLTPGGRRRIHGASGLALVAATLFMVWGLASTTWAISQSAAFDALVRWALGALLLVIIASAVGRERSFRAVAGAYVIGAALAATIALATQGGVTEDRLGGAIGDPNMQAAALVPAALLAMSFSLTSRRGRRITWATIAVVCLVALLATGSRGGLVALVISAAVLLVVAGPWRKQIAVAIGVAALTGTAYVSTFAPDSVQARVAEFAGAAPQDGGTGRTDIWIVGVRAFHSAPVEGVGLGNYTEAAARNIDEPGLIRRTDLIIGDTKVAHNMYLHVVTEVGIVGLVLFLTLIAASLGVAATAIRSASTYAPTGLLFRALLAGTIGVLSANVFISGQYETELWILLGLCLASGSLGVARAPSPVRHRMRAPKPVRVTATPAARVS